MPNKSVLMQFSDALSALAESGAGVLADVRSEKGHRLSGVLWRPNAVVVSEQALPDESEFEVRVGDHVAKARLAGRDEGTNVAVLRLDKEIAGALPFAAVPKPGAIALVLSAGANGFESRMATVRSVGSAWQSVAGGTVDHRIVLNAWLGAMEEGGPVLGANGAFLGISTRGARRETLVIPASTVERAASVLLEKGSIERGWLGLALHPVALPETLRPQDTQQRVGLMVMDVTAESPAAKAGILAGDIVLSAGGAPATRPRKIAQQLGANSIGKTIPLTLARAGAIVTREAVIEARKHE